MGKAWAKLGLGIGGAVLGGMFGVPQLGFLAGSFAGSMLFPTENKSEMPPVHDYPVQKSAAGIPITIVEGTAKVPGNVIWMGDLVSYQIKQKASGGGKGGGNDAASYETRYRRSFILAICEGPATIFGAWKGKKAISTSDFTTYNGDGNSGISTLIGEDYAEYSNMLLAYFDNYELGNTQALPNIIFEVGAGITGGKTIFLGGAADGGKHLWRVSDNGVALSLVDSFTLPGNVKQIRYSSYNDKLYIVIGNSVYCYNPSDITLDTSWGVSGKVDFDAVYRLKVDSLGYAIVVANDGATTLTLLDASGTKVWQANHGTVYEGDFDKDGNIIFCLHGSVGGRAWKISRVDGSYIESIYSGGGAGVWCRFMVADKTKDWCWYDKGFGTGSLYAYGKIDSWSEQWRYGFGPDSNYKDARHIPSLDKLVIEVDGKLTIRDCYTNANIVESSPVSVFAMDLSSDNEIFIGSSSGSVSVYNTAMVEQRSLDIGNSDLVGCALREDGIPTEVFDVNFATMIKDLLTNERYGGYSEDDLITEDFNSVRDYCEINNLKGSLAITQQRPLPDWMVYICSHFQGYFYEIGGKIGLNCYREQSSVLSITQDDLIRDGDESPVHVTKRRYDTTFNRLEVTWTDRDNDYKTAVVPAFDRIDQRESGQVRTKTIDLKAITNDELASKMVWRVFIDQLYRFSQYSFSLGYKSMLLEVGDVIDITDGYLLTAKKMRVMLINEEKDGRRAQITAIEDISDFYPTINYPTQQSETAAEPTITLADGTIVFREDWNSNKLHLSLIPGNEQCNGFYVYKSYDDASYDLIGRSTIAGVTGGDANSIGTIQSNLLAHTAVIHRKGEWFDVSVGTLTDLDTAITDDSFFNKRKLARIGNEIIGYKTCVESSVEGTWRISNLIRGLFGTKPVAHVSGETFATLDIDFTLNLQESDIGKTLYFKIVSFYASEIQLLSDVSSQSCTIAGNYLKSLPVSLMRIKEREGLSTYIEDDVIIEWYFCSKLSGFGNGGYGNALWGAFTFDESIKTLAVTLKETDDTEIISTVYDISDVGLPMALLIKDADRNGKNPFKVEIRPGSTLAGMDSREIEIEKI